MPSLKVKNNGEWLKISTALGGGGGNSVIKIVPKLLYSGSGTLTQIDAEDAPNVYTTTISTSIFFNKNKDYLVEYNGTSYRVNGKAMSGLNTLSGTYLGNFSIIFESIFGSLGDSSGDNATYLLALLLIMVILGGGTGGSDLGNLLDPDAVKNLEPFLILDQNGNNIIFMTNDGSSTYDLKITELNIEIEDPVNTYIQPDYLQFNPKHPGFIKNKLAGIELTGNKFYDGLAGDLNISSFTGPDDVTIYEAELETVNMMQLALPLLPMLMGTGEMENEIKNGYMIVKIDETYQLLPMISGNIEEEMYFGNMHLVVEDAEDTGEDFFVVLVATEVDETEAFQGIGYTRIKMTADTPLSVEMALGKAISKDYLPTIAEEDVPSAIVNYKKSYSNYILKDEENGFEYIIISRNGNLVSYCSAKSIAVTTPPTKTTYKKNETFDPTGMIVTITRQDGTTEETTNYTYPTSSLTNTDQTSITITYEEAGRYYYTTTPIKVTA